MHTGSGVAACFCISWPRRYSGNFLWFKRYFGSCRGQKVYCGHSAGRTLPAKRTWVKECTGLVWWVSGKIHWRCKVCPGDLFWYSDPPYHWSKPCLRNGTVQWRYDEWCTGLHGWRYFCGCGTVVSAEIEWCYKNRLPAWGTQGTGDVDLWISGLFMCFKRRTGSGTAILTGKKHESNVDEKNWEQPSWTFQGRDLESGSYHMVLLSKWAGYPYADGWCGF